jgi:hypothetical protein
MMQRMDRAHQLLVLRPTISSSAVRARAALAAIKTTTIKTA